MSEIHNDDSFSGEDALEDALYGKYLTFHVGREDYGFGIRYVTEIVGIQKITDVPDMPNFIKGVINLRGKVIPVMDVRLRFGMPPKDYDDRTCIIVVQVQGKDIGLLVDEVREVTMVPDEQINPPPRSSSCGARYISGMGKVGNEVKILLDITNLLFDEEMQMSGSTFG